VGTATVSDDGTVIKSDPGVGVTKAGWYCGGNSQPTGSAGTCGDCNTCQGSSCVADPAQIGSQCMANVCKICKGVGQRGVCGIKPPSGIGPIVPYQYPPGGLHYKFKIFTDPLNCSSLLGGTTIVEALFIQNNSCASPPFTANSIQLFPDGHYEDTIGINYVPSSNCSATVSQQILWLDPDTGQSVQVTNNLITFDATVSDTTATGAICLQGHCCQVLVDRSTGQLIATSANCPK